MVSTFVTLSHAVFGVIHVTFVTKDVRQGFRLSFKLDVTRGVSKRVINVSQLSEKVSQIQHYVSQKMSQVQHYVSQKVSYKVSHNVSHKVSQNV